jgi:hypothetical protein
VRELASEPSTRHGLTAAARHILQLAVAAHADDPATTAWLRGQIARLDEPLRVAIAGKVKAGKSTLLNALVGEQVAPTDAGECTKVVTWYRDGPVPRIVLEPRSGPPQPLAVVRRDGALVVDLGGTPAERVERLVVDWPSRGLRASTLIDTPGISSLSSEVSHRAVAFLDPDDESPTEADAVVYLMRHLHSADADFLESFRDRGVARATAVNTVAVLSRADEVGGGRVDALFSARSIAARYRADPAVRGLAQDVVAVAGLLAETARTLRLDEFSALAELARTPREQLDGELLSVSRFLRADPDVRGPLVRRFGIFGVRLSATLIRQGCRTPAALSTELLARSGLDDLRRVLHTRFTERRELLKARSALLAVESLLHAGGPVTGRRAALAAEIERILAGAHEFTELRTLGALRSGTTGLPRPVAEEAERLLGDAGSAPAVRLGLAPDAPPHELRRAGFAALDRWRRHAVDPMLAHPATETSRVVVRTCEGILAALNPAPSPAVHPR